MKVGLYQFNPKRADLFANRKLVLDFLNSLETGSVDLLVLPELAFSGYLFEDEKELYSSAQSYDDLFFCSLQDWCNKNDSVLISGFAERVEGYLYNSAIILFPNCSPKVYRKNHLYAREKIYFKQGNLGFPVFEFKDISFGVLICFDHLFPEAARTLALKGAQLICHPSNLVLPGYAQITTVARALENRVHWVLANRWGKEKTENFQLSYSGSSRIISSTGKVLVEAKASEDAFLVVDIDPRENSSKRLGSVNDLFDDRRTDIYEC